MNIFSKMSPFAALLKDFMVEIDKTQIVGWSFLYKGKEIIIRYNLYHNGIKFGIKNWPKINSWGNKSCLTSQTVTSSSGTKHICDFIFTDQLMRKEEKFLTDIKNDLRSTGEKEENLIKYFLDRFRGKSYIVYQKCWTLLQALSDEKINSYSLTNL